MAPRNYSQVREFQIRVEALMTQITNLRKVLAYDETVKVLESKLVYVRHYLDRIYSKKETVEDAGGVWDLQAWRVAFKSLVDKSSVVDDIVDHANRLHIHDKPLPKAKPTGQPPQQAKQAIGFSAVNNNNAWRPTCIFCNQDHRNKDCPTYTTTASRIQLAREKKLCFKCLKPGHGSTTCTWRNCFRCSRAHNTLLCLQSDKPQSNERPVKFPTFTQQKEKKESANLVACSSTLQNPEKMAFEERNAGAFKFLHANEGVDHSDIHEPTRLAFSAAKQSEDKTTNAVQARNSALMMSVTAKVFSPDKRRSEEVLIFLDSGCSETYISSKLVKKLKLAPVSNEKFGIVRMGEKEPNQLTSKGYKFLIETQDDDIIQAYGVELEHIINPINVLLASHDELKLYMSETPMKPYMKKREPDILLGLKHIALIELSFNTKLSNGFSIFISRLGPIYVAKGTFLK